MHTVMPTNTPGTPKSFSSDAMMKPDIIAPALQIPGGAMAQVRNNGGKGTVDREDRVSVDAIRTVPDPVYATPVPPKGD